MATSFSHEWHTMDLLEYLKVRYSGQKNQHEKIFNLVVLDPPYRMGNGSKLVYKSKHLQQMVESVWLKWWRQVANRLTKLSQDGCALVLFERPENLQKIIDIFQEGYWHYHHDYYLVPHPESPRFTKRHWYVQRGDKPRAVIERCAVMFLRQPRPELPGKTSLYRAKTNVHYHYMNVPGHQCPEFHYNGMKDTRFLSSIFTLLAHPQGMMLDGFAGSGNVWRALLNTLECDHNTNGHGDYRWSVDSVDIDPQCAQFGTLEDLPSSNWVEKMEQIFCMRRNRESNNSIAASLETSIPATSQMYSMAVFLRKKNPDIQRLRRAIMARGQLSYHDRAYINFGHLRELAQAYNGHRMPRGSLKMAIERLLEVPTIPLKQFETKLKQLKRKLAKA